MTLRNGARAGLPLEQVIDLHEAQRIQDTFSQATGFAALMVSTNGIPLTHASNFRPLCTLIRSTERGNARCANCDAAGGYAAHASGKTQAYVCDNGLIDVVAPITVGGTFVGGIYCGQVLPAESHEELLEEIVRRNEYLRIPREELLAIARRVPVLPRERIEAAAKLLQLMANQIMQLGVEQLEHAERERIGTHRQTDMIQLQQSLLNAHVLSNSLALVGSSASEEHAPRTEEMVYCLSEMLRYSLRSGGQAVPLEQEVRVIRHYLRVQQLRFGARLRVEIHVDPALHSLPVPPMILQPLVENAVLHGAAPLKRPVMVQVRISHQLEGVMIQVCDDGVGVETAVAHAINSRRHAGQGGHSLDMVIRRLEAEYGPRCAVRVEGAPGAGTQVMVYMPMKFAPTHVPARPVAAEPRPVEPPAAPQSMTPLERALAFMHGNLGSATLSLSEVARAASISPSHLAALMRQSLGHGYLEHLTSLRIKRARHLLRTSDMTIAAIAEAVGYQTPAHFYRRFKQLVGMTPMQFRQEP